jgi:hypothetical protein
MQGHEHLLDGAGVQVGTAQLHGADAGVVDGHVQLAITWYATGMDRILDVRKALQPWAEKDCVQALDDQLYGWQATLSSLQR